MSTTNVYRDQRVILRRDKNGVFFVLAWQGRGCDLEWEEVTSYEWVEWFDNCKRKDNFPTTGEYFLWIADVHREDHDHSSPDFIFEIEEYWKLPDLFEAAEREKIRCLSLKVEEGCVGEDLEEEE